MKNRASIIISAILPLLLLTGAAFIVWPRTAVHHSYSAKSPRGKLAQTHYRRDLSSSWISGVALDRYRDLGPWIASTRQKPDVVEIYSRFSDPFPSAEVLSIVNRGALPVIQLQPRHISLASIVNGDFDKYLAGWSASLQQLHARVAISFAHEMNGDWYTWGCATTPASLYKAAWRHVHDIIGTSNIIWMWSVNKTWNGSCRMEPRYPGDRYVDWIGIDGYLREPDSTFKSVFAITLRKLRAFTGSKPILLAETGVPVNPNQAHQIRELYQGAIREKLLGVIYFDAATRKGDYRPQDNPAGLKAFRKISSRDLHGL